LALDGDRFAIFVNDTLVEEFRDIDCTADPQETMPNYFRFSWSNWGMEWMAGAYVITVAVLGPDDMLFAFGEIKVELPAALIPTTNVHRAFTTPTLVTHGAAHCLHHNTPLIQLLHTRPTGLAMSHVQSRQTLGYLHRRSPGHFAEHIRSWVSWGWSLRRRWGQ